MNKQLSPVGAASAALRGALAMALALIAALALTACASSYSKDYRTYAASEAARVPPEKKPLLKITAQDGKDITGLASIEVYAPDGADTKLAAIQPPVPQPNPFLQGLSIVTNGIVGLAAPGAQAYGMRQQTILGVATTLANVKIKEADAGMLTNIVTGAFNSQEKGYGAAFNALVAAGAKPTTQIITGDGSPVTIGHNNQTQGGHDNRQGSPGPCTTAPTVTTPTPAPTAASNTTGTQTNTTPVTVAPVVTSSTPCTAN